MIRDIETKSVEYTGPTHKREPIVGKVETELTIVGEIDTLPDVITLNGTRYIRESK